MSYGIVRLSLTAAGLLLSNRGPRVVWAFEPIQDLVSELPTHKISHANNRLLKQRDSFTPALTVLVVIGECSALGVVGMLSIHRLLLRIITVLEICYSELVEPRLKVGNT